MADCNGNGRKHDLELVLVAQAAEEAPEATVNGGSRESYQVLALRGMRGPELAARLQELAVTDWATIHDSPADTSAISYQLRQGSQLVIESDSDGIGISECSGEQQKSARQMIATLSHELRAPLSVIRGAVDLIGRSDRPDDLARGRIALDRQVDHVAHLLDRMLDVATLDQQIALPRAAAVDVSGICREAIADASLSQRGRDAVWSVELPSKSAFVRGDAARLRQLFDVLLDNACRYCEREPVIDVGISRVAGRLRIRVSDEGFGMQPDVEAHAFEPFWQAEQGLARDVGGLGLGLTLARSIVRLHGGRIGCHSPGVDQGTTFTIELPAMAEVPHQADAPTERKGVPRRVLLIDDNVDCTELLRALLELDGHQVTVANDGDQGLALVDSVAPDIVFCDLGLPGRSGFEVARAVRDEHAEPPPRLVALTGYGAPADRRRSAQAGFDAHLTKPAPFDAIREQLSQS